MLTASVLGYLVPYYVSDIHIFIIPVLVIIIMEVLCFKQRFARFISYNSE